jgi:hypothetical protein
MSIKYQIIQNELKSGEVIPFFPRIYLNGNISGKDLINAICWGSTLTPADCLAFLTSLERVLKEQLASGFGVDLGFLKMKPALKGSFSGLDERFSKNKHFVRVKAQISKKFMNKVAELSSPVKMENSKPVPILLSFYNFSLEQSAILREGDLVEIRGYRLQFDKENPKLGVFLVKTDGTRVPVTEYAKISATRLIFKIPSFPDSTEFFGLEMEGLFGREIRKGTFKGNLQFSEKKL